MPIEAKQVCDIAEDMISDRLTNWDDHWQKVADLFMPTREFNSSIISGSRERKNIFDSTPENALDRFASSLHGLGTNPGVKWFSLNDEDEDIDNDPEARSWFAGETEAIFSTFSNPLFGFNTQSHESYRDLSGFGSATMYHVPDIRRREIIFENLPLGEVYWRRSRRMHIDTVLRVYEMTAREMIEEFGEDAVSEDAKKAAKEAKTASKKFEILYLVMPRQDRRPGGAESAPWASVFVERQKKHKLLETGFAFFPYITARMTKRPGEDYGRGLGMKGVGPAALLNNLKKLSLVAGEKHVDPTLIVEANSIEGDLRTMAGGIIWRRAGGRNPIDPLNPNGNLGWMQFLLESATQEIKDLFFFDIIGPLPVIDRQTAVEVMQRVQQQGAMMSPILSRVDEEFWTPVVLRTLRFRLMMGLTKPVPDILRGRMPKVRFRSSLAMAQKSSDVQALDQWLVRVEQYAAFDPRARLLIDGVEAGRLAGNRLNVPPGVMRTDDQIAQINEAEVRQASSLTDSETAKNQSEAVKNVADAMETAGVQ